MAGDWIKMRDGLFTHPKFIALANMLTFGDHHGMLIYTCGVEALEIGGMPPSNENVTDRALRCVTERALRDVTMCALLRVWCSVNEHCKVLNDDDAILPGLAALDLDVIAGFDGFGESLAAVGWVEEVDNSLVFKGFLEHNEPACLRVKPKTNAERQRKHRQNRRQQDRQQDRQQVGVTKVTKSNAREEKRREEKSINTLPPADEEICLETGKPFQSDSIQIPPEWPTSLQDAARTALRQHESICWQKQGYYSVTQDQLNFGNLGSAGHAPDKVVAILKKTNEIGSIYIRADHMEDRKTRGGQKRKVTNEDLHI